MGNRIRLRRNPRHYRTPQAGRLDAYRCDRGGGYTITVDVDQGRVPAVIGCRADCCAAVPVDQVGRARSIGRPADWPAWVPVDPGWEWYAPDPDTLLRLRSAGGDVWTHVRTGGLLIRRRVGRTHR